MPDAPLSSTTGRRAGSSGSVARSRRSWGEVHGAAVDLAQQQFGDRRQAALGVAHRRGAVAVARAEVALAVDQRIAQREVLRHAHHGVIDAGVAVRVIFADHVADHARALDMLGAGARRISFMACRMRRCTGLRPSST
jgi:hypothetical protein